MNDETSRFHFERIVDRDNILRAIDNSSRGGKKKRRNVRRVLDNADKCAAEIQEMLMGKTYQPAKYWEEKIWDGGLIKRASDLQA